MPPLACVSVSTRAPPPSVVLTTSPLSTTQSAHSRVHALRCDAMRCVRWVCDAVYDAMGGAGQGGAMRWAGRGEGGDGGGMGVEDAPYAVAFPV